MYTDRFSLPFLAGVLISAAERRRPGLGPWSPDTREALRQVFAAELAQIRSSFLEMFDDKAHWEKLERTLMDVCFLRYCAVAEAQTQLEGKGYGLWRGGDLFARIGYGGAALLVGLLLARLRVVPLPAPYVLALLGGLGGPFLPDLQMWLHRRGFKKKLNAIVEDMREAEQQQRLYVPLDAPQRVDEGIERHRDPDPAGRIRNGG